MEKYHEVVKNYIKKSKLSLNQIAEELKKIGIETDKYYLSKLQNGKVPPAEEGFNRAFSKVTGNDPDPLIFSSYIERTPKDIREIIDHIKDFTAILDDQLEKLLSVYHLKDLVNEDIQKQLSERGIPLSDENYLNYIMEVLTFTEKWNLFFIISNEAKVFSIGTPKKPEILIDFPSVRQNLNPNKGNPNALSTIFEDFFEDEMQVNWDIPILKHLYKNGTFEDSDYIGLESINRYDLDNQPSYILKVHDYGMSTDGIEKGDDVLAHFTDNVEAADIAVVAIKDRPAVIRRVQFYEDLCILRPSNPVMKLSVHGKSDIKVLGKVIEVRQRRKV